jgi:hypothetical protein
MSNLNCFQDIDDSIIASRTSEFYPTRERNGHNNIMSIKYSGAFDYLLPQKLNWTAFFHEQPMSELEMASNWCWNMGVTSLFQ